MNGFGDAMAQSIATMLVCVLIGGILIGAALAFGLPALFHFIAAHVH